MRSLKRNPQLPKTTSSPTMATPIPLLLLTLFPLLPITLSTPTPTPWPQQFHSILIMNKTGEHQLIDLWYDYPNGRNFNIIRSQLDPNILYDLEWNNGSTFYYTLGGEERCRKVQLEVGILRPDWLDGAEYVGVTMVDGFLCDVWTKADFIVYYEDKETKRPVRWRFYTGREAHVMSFEVGAALEDAKWQVPYYCFSKKVVGTENSLPSLPDASGALMNSDFRDFAVF